MIYHPIIFHISYKIMYACIYHIIMVFFVTGAVQAQEQTNTTVGVVVGVGVPILIAIIAVAVFCGYRRWKNRFEMITSSSVNDSMTKFCTSASLTGKPAATSLSSVKVFEAIKSFICIYKNS